MILFISHYAGRTGAPIALLHILKWLSENTSLSFEILLMSGGELKVEFSSIAKTFIYNNSRNPFSRPAGYEGISLIDQRHLRKRDYEVIYSNTITNSLFISSSFSNTIPLVTHCHEMDYWMDRIGEKAIQTMVGRTKKFIACSRSSARCLEKRGVPSESISIVPGPFVPSLNTTNEQKGLRDKLGISDNSFVVISGGEQGWRKGTDLFLQLSVLLSRNKRAEFDFIWLGKHCEGEFDYWLNASAKYAGIVENIHWQGLVENPKEYFSISDCFVMLSREDPMPLIAIEAGSMGLPVICFEGAGGTSDWVSKSEGGRVVDYLDVCQVAEMIDLYQSQPSLLRACAMNAKRICNDEFSVNNVGPRILSIIDSLTDNIVH